MELDQDGVSRRSDRAKPGSYAVEPAGWKCSFTKARRFGA